MTQFVLNLLLALLWLFLGGSNSFVSFLVGYAVGFVLLWLFRAMLPQGGYVRRTLALLRFLGVFAGEFLSANVTIARANVFGRRADLYPNFLDYDVSGLSRFEILVLSHCITLTPGTSTVAVSDDGQTLVLHAFDARDPQAVRAGIDRGLRDPLLTFTR